MSNQLQTMDVLKQALISQNQHGQALVTVIERMEAQEKRIETKLVAVEDMVEAVSKKIHLDDKEAHDISSLVATQSVKFAKQYFIEQRFSFPVGTNLFLSKVGQMRGVIYRRLKSKFNVTKYTHIKHSSFNEALRFIESMGFDWLTEVETRWTHRQLEMLNDIK